MFYTLRFFSSKCSLFHNANLFGSCIIHISYTECAKIKKNNSDAKGLSKGLCGVQNYSYEDENNLLFTPGMELQILGRPASSSVTIPVCRINIDMCLQAESLKCVFNSSYA